jgi:hypothetical protein
MAKTSTMGRRRSGTAVRIYGGFMEWILLMLAREFMAPWLVGFIVLPLAGQLGYMAFGSSWWRWLILWLVVFYAGPVPVPYATRTKDGPTRWRWLWIGLSVWTFGEAVARGKYGRWRAAISTVFALDAVAITQAIGIMHWRGFMSSAAKLQWPVSTTYPWAGIYAVFAFLVCFTWNLRRTEAVRGGGDDDHATKDEPTELQKIFKTVRPPKIVKSEEIHPGVRETLIYHRGDTTETIQAGLPNLASEYGLPREGHHATASPKGAAYTKITTVSWPMLDTPFPWPGPSAPGASIDVPCRVGIYQDGLPLEIVRAGTPKPKAKGDPPKRNTTSVLEMGTTGSGKTEGSLAEFADAITRRDCVWWWVDTVKGGQTADDIRPALDWLATSEHEALAMVASLRQVIAYRAKALRKLGLREWDRTAWERARIPFLLVHIEEFAAVAELFDNEIVRRSEQVRSVGISLSVSLQRASAENMRTGMRSNLGSSWCFGIRDSDDASMVLSEATVKAGANPGLWVNREPGKCYIEAIHTDVTRWPIPGRTYDPIDPPVLRAHVARWAPHMAQMDAGSARAAGAPYATRAMCDLGRWVEENGVNLSTPIPAPRMADTPPDGMPTQPPDEEDHVPMSTAEIEEMHRREDRDEAERNQRARRDPDVTADMDAADPNASARPIDPVNDIQWGDELPPPRRMSRAELNRALVDAFRGRFKTAGYPPFLDLSTSVMAEDWAATGVFGRLPDGTYANMPNRAALSGRLEKLRKDGHVMRVDPPEGEPANRGRTPAVWRIKASVLEDPPADSEPDTEVA